MALSTKKTIEDLKDELYSYPDAGIALTIKEAIDFAIEHGRLSAQDSLNSRTLGVIYNAIYDTNDPSRGAKQDPLEALFRAFTSPSAGGNSVEGAIQYIEQLQSQLYLS